MLSSCKTCCFSLFNRAQQLFLNVNRCRRRRSTLSSSNSDLISSSFAAMELSGQFKQVFKVMDANGDGKISSIELSQVLLCLGHEKSTASKTAQGMIREIDFNGDGFIDLDEFMDAVVVNNSGEGEGDGEEGNLMDAFRMFDSDKNGLISAKELRRVLIRLGFDKCSVKDCKRMIRGVDKDGDGFVDFKEFRTMMNSAPADPTRGKSQN